MSVAGKLCARKVAITMFMFMSVMFARLFLLLIHSQQVPAEQVALIRLSPAKRASEKREVGNEGEELEETLMFIGGVASCRLNDAQSDLK